MAVAVRKNRRAILLLKNKLKTLFALVEHYKRLFLFIISFLIVAFGQAAWLGFLSYPAAFLGYALLWGSTLNLDIKKRFLIFWVWGVGVECIHLSWMTATELQGLYILFVYSILALLLGLEIALFSLLLPQKVEFSKFYFLALPSLWTLMEWSRLYVFSGFTWNPVGLALSYNHLSLQLASLFGVYGLSFWVIFTNFLGYSALFLYRKLNFMLLWLLCALTPYIFGIMHQFYWEHHFQNTKKISALLVQTALLPGQKEWSPETQNDFISPYEQWERILVFLKDSSLSTVDLIALPEGSLPYGANLPIYQLDGVKIIFNAVFGKDSLKHFPELKDPWAKQVDNKWFVSNAFWVQTIANLFKSEVLLGLEDLDEHHHSYNAAFHFLPSQEKYERYEKRILIPMVEYFPFKWCADVAKSYGIASSFEKGKQAKVFGKIPLSPSICYEETYPHIVRESKQKGAALLVNITNDVWFLHSKLPEQHFEHGKIRAVENGLPVLRACNTGVTGAIDSFGREIATLHSSHLPSEKLSGALPVILSLNTYTTLYSYSGNYFIISFCFLNITIATAVFLQRKKLKKLQSLTNCKDFV